MDKNDFHTASTDDQIAMLASELVALQRSAAQAYSRMIDNVENGIITDEKEIERIMDGLLDFGDFPECLEQYKRLCRLVYFRYPQLVGEHVMLFRRLWDSDEQQEDN